MSLFYRKLQACSLVLAVGLAACSETSGPTDGFTVAAASADLAAMQGAFETEAFQSLSALGDNFSADIVTLSSGSARLIEAASDPERADDVADASAQIAGALNSSASPIPILQNHAGKEFEYSVAEGHYVVGSGQGPANGVRFIIYAVNPVTEEIAEPLNPIGHVEIIDLSPAPTNQVSVQITVVSDGVTYAQYVVSATLGATSGIGLAVDAEGFLSDGTTRADFTVSYNLNFDFGGARVTIDYSVDVAELDFGMDVSWVLEGTEGQGTVEVDARLTHAHARRSLGRDQAGIGARRP